MKRYFNHFIILVLAVVLSESVKAQSDSSYFKFAIKTNALQWIMNEPNVAFEYRSSQKSGIEVTVGTYGIYQISDYAIAQFPPFMPYKGVTFRINPKAYILTEAKFKGKAFYLSPMLLIRSVKIKDSYDLDYSTVYFDKKRTTIGLSLLAGIQGIESKRILIDGYFGLGARINDDEPINLDSGAGFGQAYI